MRANPLTRLRAFQKDPFSFFDEHKPEDTSKPVRLRMGHKLFYFSYDPNHAQHILQDSRHKYDKSSLVLKKIKALSGPEGLIQLKGEDALRVRQSSAQLMNTSGMDRLVEKVSSFVEELYPIIDESIAKNKALDLVPHLTKIVLRTAGVFVLNHDLLSESDELNKAFVSLNREAGESLRSMVGCPFSMEKRRSLKTIHNELKHIASTTSTKDEPSLLKNLGSLNKSESFVKDQLKAFMFAGYDTTASSLIYATYLTAAHPETQKQIANESETKQKQNYETLRSSKLVQSTYLESLRLYPSAYFLPRETNQADVLGGVNIAKGAQVFLSVRHIQRHPDYFESPDEFRADRFLTDPKHPFSFLPFGGGPRICIGALLAKLEATLVLQKLCERYEMITQNNSAPEIEGLVTAHTKDPLPIFFKRRQAQTMKAVAQ